MVEPKQRKKKGEISVEPKVFIIKFKTEADDIKGSWNIAKIGPVFERRDGTSIINKKQLEVLDKLNVRYELLSIPPTIK